MTDVKRILKRHEVARALAARTMLTTVDAESQAQAQLRDAAFLALVDQGHLLAYEDEQGQIVFEPIVRH